MQFVSNIIVYGVYIYDCKVVGFGDVCSMFSYVGYWGKIDGDVINIFGFCDIWIDYCYFFNFVDGFVDVIEGFNSVMILNNYFENYDKVMLLGVYDGDNEDKNMYVMVVFNYFGVNFVEWMLRYVSFGNMIFC